MIRSFSLVVLSILNSILRQETKSEVYVPSYEGSPGRICPHFAISFCPMKASFRNAPLEYSLTPILIAKDCGKITCDKTLRVFQVFQPSA